jgi:hypothetical protein
VIATPRVTYVPRRDATPETEISALASVYAFILQSQREKQKGGAATAPDARKETDESGEIIIPNRI